MSWPSKVLLRRRCHRQLIARHFHLISPGGADPRLDPGDINVEDDLVTFSFISTAPREHALEKFNTFRVRGVRLLVLFAVLCHREDKEAATLRVVGVPRRVLAVRGGSLARRHFLASEARQLPRTDNR